jgi:positive regulator of sigma E activity
MEGIIFSVIIGFVIGTLFFYYDSKSGKKLYRKWHNISSKNKLDPNLNVGFVNGQLFGQKLTVAITISVVLFVLAFLSGALTIFQMLFYSLGFFLGTMIAFYLAPKFLAVFSKKASDTIDYIESIEKGDKKLTEELNKVLPKKEAIVQEEPKAEETPKENEIEQPNSEEPKKEDNWRDGVNKFLDK